MGAGEVNSGADASSWDAGLEDESSALMKAVGRQVKGWREAADFRQCELGSAIGYGEEMVSAVERGRRLPRPEFLAKADEVLGAGGKLAAMKDDVAVARYPKKVRDVAKLEAEARELGAYVSTVIDGLLQTEEYARELFGLRIPAYDEDEVERLVAARMARQDIFDWRPARLLTFVQEESTLLRPVGGRMAMRRQLERLLELGELRHVEIQVMPTGTEGHRGLGGSLRVLKLKDGTTLGLNEVQLTSRLISEPEAAQVLAMRYGLIQAQAMTPRESLAFIERMRGEV